MKFSLLFLRICIANLLTLAIGVLPHHHHHGEPCWVVDTCDEHQHEGENHGKECPSAPCSESSCYLNSIKSFMQAERTHADTHPYMCAVLPELLQCEPPFIYFSNPEIALSGYLHTTAFLTSESRRGPPIL